MKYTNELNIKIAWLPVVGYEGLYEVSNYGDIKKVDGLIINVRPPNVIQYYTVCLNKNKKRKTKFNHRLVAQAWIINPLNLPQVNHIDGNKLNNCVLNLEWCTPSDNIKHAIKTGLKFSTENHKAAVRFYNKQKRKIVLDVVTGIFYDGVLDASKTCSYTRNYLSKMLSGAERNQTNLIYC